MSDNGTIARQSAAVDACGTGVAELPLPEPVSTKSETTGSVASHSGSDLRMGVFLGICAAVGYSGANLALRQLAVPNDPGWAVWVTANKAIPAALVAWFMIMLQWSKGQPGLPPAKLIGRLILAGLAMQYGGNFMFQWSLSLGGLAVTVPVCFSMLIIAGAWMARVVCGEPITPKTMGAIGDASIIAHSGGIARFNIIFNLALVLCYNPS